MTKTTSTKTTRKKRTYSDADYNSGDGMLTTVWGPSMWHYLHTMSFNYPVKPTAEDKKHYRDFILLLQHVLPCKYCRMNFKKNLQDLPLTMKQMESRETFSRYIFDMHQLINRMLKKKVHLTYEDVRERYEHFRARCTEDRPKLFVSEKKKEKGEKGCTEPLYGKKSKCLIKIVPQEDRHATFHMDKKCIKTRRRRNQTP